MHVFTIANTGAPPGTPLIATHNTHNRSQGLWPNYLKVVPSIAIAFVTYEQVKEFLGVEIRISE